jgi:hypothetical protein
LSRGKPFTLVARTDWPVVSVRVGVRMQGPWVPLWRDLPLPPDVSEAAAVPLKSKSKLCYNRRSVGQFDMMSSTHLEFTTRFLLLSDSCGFVDVGRSLWREYGSVVYNCCWSSPAKSWPYFTVSDSRLPQPGVRSPFIYIPQEEGDPVIPPSTGFPFRRLLLLAGLRWMYSNQPPPGSSRLSLDSRGTHRIGNFFHSE